MRPDLNQYLDKYIKVDSFQEIEMIRQYFTVPSFWEHLRTRARFPLYIQITYSNRSYDEGWTANGGNWLEDKGEVMIDFSDVISDMFREELKIKEEIGL